MEQSREWLTELNFSLLQVSLPVLLRLPMPEESTPGEKVKDREEEEDEEANRVTAKHRDRSITHRDCAQFWRHRYRSKHTYMGWAIGTYLLKKIDVVCTNIIDI